MNPSSKTDHNRYDHVFKVLAEPLLPYVLGKTLEIPNVPLKIKYKKLKNELLKPRERRVDGFFLIDLPDEPKFILHLEFQSTSDPDMIYRVAEYHGMGLREYKLPIRHVVVYIGQGPVKMRTTLDKSEVFESFTLLDLSALDTASLLASEAPAEVVLACLGDYGASSSADVLGSIVGRLQVLLSGEGLREYLGHLHTLVGLRDGDFLLTKIIESMQIDLDYDYRTHHLYKQGLEQGLQKGLQKGRYEGLEQGLQKGRYEGLQKGRRESIRQGALELRARGMTLKDTAAVFKISVAQLRTILKSE